MWSSTVSELLCHAPHPVTPAIDGVDACGHLNTGPRSWYRTSVIDMRSDTQSVSPHRMVALDPGTKSFVTGFTSDGAVIRWGVDGGEFIANALDFARSLQASAKASANNRRERDRLLRLAAKTVTRMRNRIEYLHNRLATHLVRNYSVVVVPKFGGREEGDEVADMWDHPRFREVLCARASSRGKCLVRHHAEERTTKTCSRCGNYNRHVKKKRRFACARCHAALDRDANAARNILIGYIAGLAKNP